MRVVVLDVFGGEPLEMVSVPDEGAVTEFAAHGADPSLRVGVAKSFRLRLVAMVVRGLFV